MIRAGARLTGAAATRTAACAAAAALAFTASACNRSADEARPLVIEAREVGFSRTNPAQRVQGKVKFRGGIELRSSDPDFGGLSALLVSADGRHFAAVTDESHWITGDLTYANGDLSGCASGWIAPMLDPSGSALEGKAGDAEGLASGIAGDITSDLYVSFEGDHRLWRYQFARDGALARPENLTLPRDAVAAPVNSGLEGIEVVGEGLMFAVSERFRNRDNDFRAWMLPYPPLPGDQANPRPTRGLAIRPIKPFAMTDLRMLPGGDLLTLERRYNPVNGVGILMRRISAASLKASMQSPDVPLDGELLVSLDPGFEIDNMEGLSVRSGEHGETLVYMVSDDNFNRPMQRTLLLMFELLP